MIFRLVAASTSVEANIAAAVFAAALVLLLLEAATELVAAVVVAIRKVCCCRLEPLEPACFEELEDAFITGTLAINTKLIISKKLDKKWTSTRAEWAGQHLMVRRIVEGFIWFLLRSHVVKRWI